MEPIKLTFLGTGNAIPTKERNHSAILLTYKNENILIDCGEGTQRQFHIARISPTKISKILITHWHGDHILGLPGLFQTLAMNDYQKTLQIYGPRGTNQFIEAIKKVFNIQILIETKEVSGEFFDSKEFALSALPVSHGIPSLAFSFEIKEKLRLDKQKIKKLKLPNSPLLGKLQQGKEISFEGKKIKPSQVSYVEKGRKVAFILDTLPNENNVKIAKDADVLICEGSFCEEEKALAQEHKHLTVSEAATIAKKANAQKLILTHISQRYAADPNRIAREAKKIFKNSVVAKDFDVFSF